MKRGGLGTTCASPLTEREGCPRGAPPQRRDGELPRFGSGQRFLEVERGRRRQQDADGARALLPLHHPALMMRLR